MNVALRRTLAFFVCVAILVVGLPEISPRAEASAGDVLYSYDAAGRLAGVVAPSGQVARYKYDAAGNIKSIERPTGVAIAGLSRWVGKPGTTVKIQGAGFSGTPSDNQVEFGGTVATVEEALQNELTVTVPTGAATGVVRVTAPTGVDETSDPFRIDGGVPPVIDAVSPMSALPGTTVTVTGSNFDPDPLLNNLSFGKMRGRITAASTTSLTTSVPEGAISGPITVTTPEGSASTSSDFVVPPLNKAVADMDSTVRMQVGETRTVSIPTAGRMALVLFEAPKDQQISISTSGSTITSTRLSLVAPDQTTLLSAEHIGTNADFVDQHTLALPGTYSILLDPDSSYTGSLTLKLNDADDLKGTITAGGDPVTFTTDVPGQDASFTFAGQKDQRVSVTMSNVGYDTCSWCGGNIYIRKPDETYFNGTGIDRNGSFLDTVRLPADGEYTLTVNPDTTDVGGGTLKLHLVPEDQVVPVLAGGGPNTISFSTPGQNANLTFDALAGDRISIKATGTGFTRGYISVTDPSGASVVPRTIIASSSAKFVDQTRLPVAGQYTLFVDPEKGYVGSTTINVFDANDATGPLTVDGPAGTLSTTSPGQNAVFSFDAVEGQRVSARITGSTLPTCTTSSAPCGTFSLRDSSGNQLSSNYGFLSTTGGFIDPVSIPATGTYQVWVDPKDEKVGSVTVQLLSVPPDVAGTITPDGTGQVVTINSAGQNARLTFDGVAGRAISLRATGSTFSSSRVSVVTPSGTNLVAPTSVPTAGLFVDQKALAVSGEYAIVVNPDNHATGAVTITLYDATDVSGSVTIDGGATTTQITTPGQNSRLTFSGLATQLLSLSLSQVSAAGKVSVLKPDGTTLWGVGSYGTTGTTISLPQLPVDGTYTIVVDPTTTNVGSVNVAVSRRAGSLAAPSFPIGGEGTAQERTGRREHVTSRRSARLLKWSAPATWGGNVPGAGDLVSIPSGSTVLLDEDSAPLGGLQIDGTLRFARRDLQLRADRVMVHGKLLVGSSHRPFLQRALITLTGDDGSKDGIGIGTKALGVMGGTLELHGAPRKGWTELASSVRRGASAIILSRAVPWRAGDRIVIASTDGRADHAEERTIESVSGKRLVLDAPVQWEHLAERSEDGDRLVFKRAEVGLLSRNVVVRGDETSSENGFGGHVMVMNDGEARISDVEFTEMGQSRRLRRYPIHFHMAADARDSYVRRASIHHTYNRCLTIHGTHHLAVQGNVCYDHFGHGYFLEAGTETDNRLIGNLGLLTRAVQDGLLTSDNRPATFWVTNPDNHLQGNHAAGSDGLGFWYALRDRAAGRVFPARTPLKVFKSNAAHSNGGGALFIGNHGDDGDVAPVRYQPLSDPSNERSSPVRARFSDLTAYSNGGRDVWVRGQNVVVTRTGRRLGSDAGRSSGPEGEYGDRTTDPGADDVTVLQGPPLDAPSPEELSRLQAWKRSVGAAPEDSPWLKVPPLIATEPTTALSGQALRADGRPMTNVVLELDGVRTTTDIAGRFLLPDVSPGSNALKIDASNAGSNAENYGYYETRVELARGTTTLLPYTVWLTKIDDRHAVSLKGIKKRDVVVTTPHIPGLELHIPKGSRVEGRDGEPLREVSLTKLPTSRPPFPMPLGVRFPVYFTIQPGGAYVLPRGAQVVYPNATKEAPGKRSDFYNYDPLDEGWYVYGQGTVSKDGKRIVPDRSTRIYEFLGASFFFPTEAIPLIGPMLEGSTDGDPVDLASGLFVYEKTDLALPGPLPITLTRTYRPGDSENRAFGRGATHSYNIYLASQHPYDLIKLVLPTGGTVKFNRVTDPAEPGGWKATAPGSFQNARLKHVSDPNGFELWLPDGSSWFFPESGHLRYIRDRYGNQITIKRNGTGVTSIWSSSGRWIEFAYGPDKRVSRITDNLGRTVSYSYDDIKSSTNAEPSDWRLTGVINPKGGLTSFGYDWGGMSSIWVRGRPVLRNYYDMTPREYLNPVTASGRLVRQVLADGSEYRFSYATQLVDEATERVVATQVTDPRGSVRRVEFDTAGRAVEDTYAVGTTSESTVSITRDAAGNVLEVVDNHGRSVRYAYTNGNVSSLTVEAGTKVLESSLTYEKRFNRVKKITDQLGRETVFTYDDSQRSTTISYPGAQSVQVDYREDGQPRQVSSVGLPTTVYNYALGDPVSVSRGGRVVGSAFVDAGGRARRAVNALGYESSMSYDALNALTATENAAGLGSSATYDQFGLLQSVTDARGKNTSYTYDLMDRLKTRTDPLGKTETFSYDQLGNPTRHIDRRGEITDFRYDHLGRPTFTGFGATLDAQGVVTSYASEVTYAYNAGRLVGVDDTAGEPISFQYDSLGRLLTETTEHGALGYTYDDAGRRTSMTAPGQAETTYAYDAADRLTQIARGSQSVGFAYDTPGRLQTLTLPNGVSEHYSYDSESRLSGIEYKDGQSVLGDLDYGFDGTGRATSVAGTFARVDLPQAMQSATYNDANQLLSWDGQTRTYDDNGNLLSDGSRSYAWNDRNQLTSVTGGSSEQYTYDALGRRSSVTNTAGTRSYLYDGSDVLQERTGGSVQATMLGGLGMDSAYARTDASGTKSFLSDRLGSTVALTDDTGALSTEYSYEPFGRQSVVGSSSSNRTTFTGREADATGLMQFRARYYDPAIGRFLSEDPAGFAGGDLNLYAYVGNDPVNVTDPTGMFWDTLIDVVFVVIDIKNLLTGGWKNFGDNMKALIMDGIGLAIPGLPGLSRLGKYADEAAQYGDEAVDGVRGAVRTSDDLAAPVGKLDDVGDACRANSFVGKTRVKMPNGSTKRISKIRPGDRVLALDPVSGARGARRVTEVITGTGQKRLVRLRVDEQTLTTTEGHPFWVKGEKRWVTAGDLTVGMRLLSDLGDSIEIDALKTKTRERRVFNLTIRELHTYFVSAGNVAILVHNCGGFPDDSGILRDAARGKGNFGIGSSTAAHADDLGKAWVGKGYTVSSDGTAWISANGLRQYRPPSVKGKLGKTQANFETRFKPEGKWTNNGHLDIID